MAFWLTDRNALRKARRVLRRVGRQAKPGVGEGGDARRTPAAARGAARRPPATPRPPVPPPRRQKRPPARSAASDQRDGGGYRPSARPPQRWRRRRASGWARAAAAAVGVAAVAVGVAAVAVAVVWRTRPRPTRIWRRGGGRGGRLKLIRRRRRISRGAGSTARAVDHRPAAQSGAATLALTLSRRGDGSGRRAAPATRLRGGGASPTAAPGRRASSATKKKKKKEVGSERAPRPTQQETGRGGGRSRRSVGRGTRLDRQKNRRTSRDQLPSPPRKRAAG